MSGSPESCRVMAGGGVCVTPMSPVLGEAPLLGGVKVGMFLPSSGRRPKDAQGAHTEPLPLLCVAGMDHSSGSPEVGQNLLKRCRSCCDLRRAVRNVGVFRHTPSTEQHYAPAHFPLRHPCDAPGHPEVCVPRQRGVTKHVAVYSNNLPFHSKLNC